MQPLDDFLKTLTLLFFFQDFCLLRINGVINNKIPKHTHTKKKEKQAKNKKTHELYLTFTGEKREGISYEKQT